MPSKAVLQLLEQGERSGLFSAAAAAPADKFGREWIPPAADDAPITDRIDVISRDVRHADFVRPAKDSPLATSGAGGDLPPYVGAIPPEEVEPWDWDKTWQAQARKND